MVNVTQETGKSIRSDLTARIQVFAVLLALDAEIAGRGSWAVNDMIRAVGINRRSRYRVVGHDRGGGLWLKGRDQVDTLCHGEVAEWLNAAVSKTVTSVIPASGVRIPPSPRCGAIQHASASACQHGDCAA